MIQDILRQSVEYQSWGWNAATVGAIGIIVFTFPEAWGGFRQGVAIWRHQSSQSVSLRWIAYMWAFFTQGIFYGYAMDSLAVAGNCVTLSVAYLPALTGSIRFSVLSRRKLGTVAAYGLMVPAMALLPWKEVMWTIFSIGVIYAVALEAKELWDAKRPGVLDIVNIAVLTCSTAFWMTFAFATYAVGMMIQTPPTLVGFAVIWMLWLKYRHNPLPSERGVSA